MPDNESALLLPLRSSASALLTGAPITAVRKRLKCASLFYERVYLEAGIYRMHAGSDGRSGTLGPPDDRDPPRWQTPARRHAGQQASFAVGIGREHTPGVPAETMTTAVSSLATVWWEATLEPFAAELPPGTDWIEFTGTRVLVGQAQQLARQWTQEDERNASLERAVPEYFVRSAVIQNANRDLATATADGLAVSTDPLHGQVTAQRFRDDDTWKLHGYAIPVLFPHVGHLPWDTIADLRRDKDMARFRAVMHQVEEEAAAEAAEGDIEAAAQHAYQRHLAGYPGTLPSVGAIAHRTLTGLIIGGIAGFYVYGITGPLGPVASAALGATAGTVIDARSVLRERRSRGWIALDHRIQALRTR